MRHVALIGMALLFVACNKKEESKTSGIEITSDTILAFQEKRATASLIEKDDFTFDFPDNFGYYFISEEYDDGSEVDATEATSCFEKGIVPTVTAAGTQIQLKASLTPNPSCIAAEKADAKSSVAEFDSAVYSETTSFDLELQLECSQDMSSYNNNNDITFDFFKACGQVQTISRKITSTGTIFVWLLESNGATQELSGASSSQEFMLAADGGPCIRTDLGSTVVETPGCIVGFSLSSTLGDSSQVQYMLANRKGLTATPGTDPWYSSGTVDFQVADWQGTLTYSSGTKAPTYTATNGKVNVSGNFEGVTGLVKPNKRLLPRAQFFGLLNQ